MAKARLPLLALGAFLALASPAFGAQRYAAPSSSDAVGSCSALAPCRLDHALNDAAAGDEVIVEPGTYDVTTALQAKVPIDLHGIVGQPRPRLVGAARLASDVLLFTNGGSIGYLEIVCQNGTSGALDADAITGSGLVIENAGGLGAELRGGSLLRDSVVQVGSSLPAVEAQNGQAAGAPKLLNDTVVASNTGAVALNLRTSATSVIRNSILRGGASDVSIGARASVVADHSNLRTPASSSYTDAGANSSADPLLGPDLHLPAGSPAIDAGTASDPDLGPSDADGAQRAFGAAPDMGAFEYGAPQSDWDGTTNPTGANPGGGGSGDARGNHISPPTPPKAGKKVTVGPVSGTVKVHTPGGSGFVTLGADATVPVGSTIDAASGVVALTSARGGGDTRPQTGRFWGGRFKVTQSASGDGYTNLVLKGGSFKPCAKAGGRARVVAAKRKRAIRRLWGQDRHGRFRSQGRGAVATVRGTIWLTEDRCEGTLFAVRKGAVSVKAKGVHKAVLLRAGQRYLARTR